MPQAIHLPYLITEKIMRTGLGFKCVTEQEAIRNYFNSMPSEVKASFNERIHAAREVWEQQALTAKYECPSDQELFSPLNNDQIVLTHPIGDSSQILLRKGFWNLQLPTRNPHSHFTITAKVGNSYRFKPYGIKQSFIHWYGRDWKAMYQQWKQLVLDDLDSARELIAASEPIAHLGSLTCCSSSERLCKRLGLRVERGIAFLFRRDMITTSPSNCIQRIKRR
jgi:hypothetical protein